MHKGRSKVVHPSVKHGRPALATQGPNLLPLVGRLAVLPGTGRSVAGSGHRPLLRPLLRLAPSSRWSPTLPSVT
jgi:hypothetical protein